MASIQAIACALAEAYTHRRVLPPPSATDETFDLRTAYAVEAALVRQRRADGRRTVGLKVGYANKAMWRVLKLDTLVWAHMYDDTVHHARTNQASLSLSRMCSPKIEPEIVFKLKRPLDPEAKDAAAVLDAVEWLALGFEIIDCVFTDWTFQPADFVAAFGLHAALVVGEPVPVTAAHIPTLVETLPRFTVRLLRNGEPAAEGSGRNSLSSPARCLGELGSAVARQAGTEPLASGDLVSSGTLTASLPLTSGATWTVRVDGLELPSLTLDV